MNQALLIFISSLYLIVPCILVNTALNIFWAIKKQYGWEKYDKSFDFDLKLPSGNPVLGTSTTWGGLIVALSLGIKLDFFWPGTFHGVLLSLSVFFGHALGSFIKRRLGYPRGKYLPIVDHGDYIILTSGVFLLLGYTTIPIALVSIIVVLVTHPLLCLIGYHLGLREHKL